MSDILSFEDADIFATAVFDAQKTTYIYAGSIRSGKTIVSLNILNVLCLAFPGSRWAVIRSDLPTIKRTVIPSYFKYCYPQRAIADYAKGEQIIKFKNGSEILFMAESFEEDPELNRFKGLEVNGFLLEQMEELHEATYLIAMTRAGQWALDPMPPRLIIGNANPAQNWVKTKFYDPWRAGTLPDSIYFQVADVMKNPYISSDYLRDLEQNLPPDIYDRYVRGNWDAADEIGQLVPWSKIHNARAMVAGPDDTLYLGVDVGRDGPDPSVWLIIKGQNISHIEAHGKTSIPDVARRTQELIAEQKIEPDNVVVDSVGLGGGVVDILVEAGFSVNAFIGGAGTDEELTGTNFRFKNQRSLACWKTAEAIKGGRLGNIVHQTLCSDIGAIRYMIKSDKQIYIEAKEEFKKRTGRSSDYWDALYMAYWARVKRELASSPGFFILK